MLAPIPEPGPDDQQRPGADGQQPPAGAPADNPGAERPTWPVVGGSGWAWVEGSADTGPVPVCDRPGPQPEPPTADGLPAGLDYAALVEALAVSGALGSDARDQDAEVVERPSAEQEGRPERPDMGAVAAVAVEHMGPGAAQVGWLEVAAGAVHRLDENALAGVAIAARQAACRAQAAELAAVAQITARAAAADPRIGLQADGRPARLCQDAIGQVKLALMLTDFSAASWADLAMTLTWRLPATGQALAGGRIDLDRARLIAIATSVLSEAKARAVEAQVLPHAPTLTRPYLQERLSRAVIKADPDGAEKRRQAAERNADVRLYADDDHTATITGSKLPQIHAAAGFARLTALARARKAAGMPGSLGFQRAQVMIAMMLDTLPYIPPADGAPPDQPPSDPDPGPGQGPDPGPGPAGDDHSGGPADGSNDGPGNDGPGRAEDGPCHQHHGMASTGDGRHDGGRDPDDRDPDGRDGDTDDQGARDDLPAPRDEDAPPDDGLDDHPGPHDQPGPAPADHDDLDLDPAAPASAWPALGVIPPAFAPRPGHPADGRPVPGLLDAVVPWTTLAGLSHASGTLGRIGPITATQARQLAEAAAHDPATQWRVIVTNSAGQAIAVARIRRPHRRGHARDGPAACRDGPPPGTGLVGRITVTITQDTVITTGRPPRPRGPGPPPMAHAALRAAARALDRAVELAAADAAAGGCAHTDQSPAYRPPPRLREFITARDVTCRSPVCRQPAWRADLDHTRPYDQHGKTCRCNLGGGCRRDHQLKQHRRWKLEQIQPGKLGS